MNIAHWLYQSACAWPNRPALYSGADLVASYGALGRRCTALAATLAGRYGIAPGDRVALFTANCPEYLEILHAIWWIGAVAVPINYKLHPREAAWILEDSGARLVFTDTGDALAGAGGCREVAISGPEYKAATAGDILTPPAPCTGSALAWLFYTSGTTGRPKGVMLSHDNLIHMALCYSADVDQPAADQVSLYAAPMSHGAGLYALPLIRAGAAHLVPTSRGFDPDEIIALAGNPGTLCFFAAPTMIKRLVARAQAVGFRGEGIRTIVYGGGPMYGADIDAALAQFGPKFVQIYGQGESPMTITALPRALVADETHPAWRARRTSVGIAQACVEVAILGPDLTPLPPETPGDIAVRGPTVMQGYWQNPSATSATIRGGWLLTGDIGTMDADGFVTLTDRSKDVIISGGSNIYPREVEEALLTHPAVFEAAVIGAPDAEWGEIVVAVIVRRPGVPGDPVELDAWCRSAIASFKKPKRYCFVPDLPKNSYGKILKTVLRERLAGA